MSASPVRRAIVCAASWAVVAGAPSGSAHALVGGVRGQDSCLAAEALVFRAGSSTLDTAASARVAATADWLGEASGRYAFLAAPEEPLAPARVQAAADRLMHLGVSPLAVRRTSFAVLDPGEPRRSGAVVVKRCMGPAPYERDWAQPPGTQEKPVPPAARLRNGAAVIGVVFGLWWIGPAFGPGLR